MLIFYSRYFLFCVFILHFSFLPKNSAKEIPQCQATTESIDKLNFQISKTLEKLRSTTFFRIFQVALDRECKFWPTNKQCSRTTCSVCECREDQIPSLQKAEEQEKQDLKEEEKCTDKEKSLSVNNEKNFDCVDRYKQESLVEWNALDESSQIVQPPKSEMSYINLTLNPHTHTGFYGESARRVQTAIYGENCFDPSDPQVNEICLERRLFFRLISGLQSSVSAHMSGKYLVNTDDTDDVRTKPNLAAFQKGLGDYPERIDNLYFAYVFMIRALQKARSVLLDYSYDTGNIQEDKLTRQYIQELMEIEQIQDCQTSKSFDESKLFNGNDKKHQIDQYKRHFRNISLIMDCVECEKCQLYGKLQVLGIGTALKIMFMSHCKKNQNESSSNLQVNQFQRNEIIALILTLAEFSDSIAIIKKFRHHEFRLVILGSLFTITMALILITIFCWKCLLRNISREKKYI